MNTGALSLLSGAQAHRLGRIIASLLHTLVRRGILASLLCAPEAAFRLRAAHLLVSAEADPAYFRFTLCASQLAELRLRGLQVKLCPLIACTYRSAVACLQQPP